MPPEAWSLRKPAALVKLLALAPGHRLRRDQVMDALWPDLDPRAAGANLRKALHAARRSLGAESGAQLIVSAGDLLCLPSDGLGVDVADYWSLVASARRNREVRTYVAAIETYRDGLLPEDVYEDWAVAPRDELRLDRSAALEELAGLLEARGDLNGAARTVQRLVAEEPLREDAHAWLMRLYALAGRRDEARRQYARLCELLHAELGTEPRPETQRQFAEINAGQISEPDLTADLWERVGDLRVQSGDHVGAVEAFERALAVCSEPAANGRIHRKCASAWLLRHLPDGAEPHLAAAEELAPVPAEFGRLVCLRANLAWERGDIAAARRLAEQAHDLARTDGDADDVAMALETLAFISHVQGGWRQGLQVQMEGLAHPAQGVRIARLCDFNHCLGQYQLYGDGFADDVEEYARRTLAVAERADAVPAQAFAWCMLGESLLLRARWEEAAACLERSCDLYAPLGSRSVALPWIRRAELAACEGDHDGAASYLKRATAIATVTPMARHAWARLHGTAALAALERGEPEGAIRAVRATQAAAARHGACLTCSALLNPVGAQVLAQVGDREGAHALASAAAQLADSFESSAWSAMAESTAASAALADGDRLLARERFQSAAALYRKAGHTFWETRTLAQMDAAGAPSGS
ncbi:BTAD domain-containing putative transcriptional regulator [Actinacidiphila reveromycinica]|uniref:BTAD domain-containing putative transcriptional regulator n=1 Tax=Actinacidiphila reveromycinica TaxID=659352 RepID=UPI0019241E73|nr:BTAD domain-containing putative transcriptional regulator [Streptomyces sp. SN-593]